MSEPMKVFYIRHNWKNRDDYDRITKELFDNKRIGVHFKDTGHENAFNAKCYKDNRAGVVAINYLKECNENPSCLIVAFYKGIDKILIGKPERGSKECRKINNKEIKTLDLTQTREITISDFAHPFLIAPPFSTFVHWSWGEKAVNTFYSNKEKIIQPEMLSPWHWEILCEEYLRRKNDLNMKLYHTGKSMKSFDIVGLDKNNNMIIAQVKCSANKIQIEEFFDLASKFHNAKSLFFTFKEVGDFRDNVIDLDDVFNFFITEREKEYLSKLIYG